MYFITDNNKKIIWGWSPKCACSHVHLIFRFLTKEHNINKKFSLPINYDNYIIIIFIRNPYERLISGFLDKYVNSLDSNIKNMAPYINAWKNKNKSLTFANFVENLGEYDIVERHHFSPQLSEYWIDGLTIKYIFDIKKINYSIIENLYNKKINKIIGIKKNKNKNKLQEKQEQKLYNETIYNLKNIKYSYNQFYNQDIKNKVYNFYKKDFIFFENHNFEFNI